MKGDQVKDQSQDDEDDRRQPAIGGFVFGRVHQVPEQVSQAEEQRPQVDELAHGVVDLDGAGESALAELVDHDLLSHVGQ